VNGTRDVAGAILILFAHVDERERRTVRTLETALELVEWNDFDARAYLSEKISIRSGHDLKSPFPM
jgi:hypothetical protein